MVDSSTALFTLIKSINITNTPLIHASDIHTKNFLNLYTIFSCRWQNWPLSFLVLWLRPVCEWLCQVPPSTMRVRRGHGCIPGPQVMGFSCKYALPVTGKSRCVNAGEGIQISAYQVKLKTKNEHREHYVFILERKCHFHIWRKMFLNHVNSYLVPFYLHAPPPQHRE